MSTTSTTWRDIADLLVDPVDGSPLEIEAISDHEHRLVGNSGRGYAIDNDLPILLAPDGRLSRWRFQAVQPAQHIEIRSRPTAMRRLVSRFKRSARGSRAASDAVDAFAGLIVRRRGQRSVVLVVGGGTVGNDAQGLANIEHATLVSFDVYPSTSTTFVADGHQIPMADRSVDAVWIQAVLEHVAEPQVVVDEIARVLTPGGMVYAETPFLQPVHEGAYDFTRFTHSGHRLLFHAFDEVASDPIGGPGAMLALALRGVIGGLTRRPSIARVAYVSVVWLAALDRLIPPAWRSDFATGTTFLGTRRSSDDSQTFDAESYYRGAQ